MMPCPVHLPALWAGFGPQDWAGRGLSAVAAFPGCVCTGLAEWSWLPAPALSNKRLLLSRVRACGAHFVRVTYRGAQ